MKPKKKKKKTSKSVLTRFFKSGNKQKKKTAKKTESTAAKEAAEKKESAQTNGAPPKAPLPTPRQRSIAEVKQMKQLGDKSPERLARVLSAILGKERVKNEADKEQFDQMVWGIIQRHEKDDAQNGDEEPPAE